MNSLCYVCFSCLIIEVMFSLGLKWSECSVVPFYRDDAEESKIPPESQDLKEKSSSSRKGNRYHPYQDKHGGEKKGAHRNRVFINNIPYDMKWQAIKDLMREKGNVPSDGGGVSPGFFFVQLIRSS